MPCHAMPIAILPIDAANATCYHGPIMLYLLLPSISVSKECIADRNRGMARVSLDFPLPLLSFATAEDVGSEDYIVIVST